MYILKGMYLKVSSSLDSISFLFTDQNWSNLSEKDKEEIINNKKLLAFILVTKILSLFDLPWTKMTLS